MTIVRSSKLDGRLQTTLGPLGCRGGISRATTLLAIMLVTAFLAPLSEVGIGSRAAALAEDQSVGQNAATGQTSVPSAKISAVDPTGDPLPEGALLRMGSTRFCPPSAVCDIALSPDERV